MNTVVRQTWRLWRWFRLVLPPPMWLGVLVTIWLATAYLAFLWMQVLDFDLTAGEAFERELQKTLLLAVNIACAAIGGFYGVYRGQAFHPIMQHEYRRWLESTPWRLGLPLPLGPVHLVPQDVLVVGVIALPCSLILGRPLWVPAAVGALGGYLTVTALALIGTRVINAAYAILFLEIAAAYFWFVSKPVMGAALAVAYVVACFGLRASLAAFPWTADRYPAIDHVVRIGADARDPTTALWPWNRLGPHKPPVVVAWREVLLLPALAACGLWVLAHFDPQVRSGIAPQGIDVGILGVVAPIAAVARLIVYAWGAWPPVSFLGRLRWGQLIVPRYDRILVAPLATLAAGASSLLMLAVLGVPALERAALALWVTLAVALGMGPTLRAWHLTGGQRFAENLQNTSAIRL